MSFRIQDISIESQWYLGSFTSNYLGKNYLRGFKIWIFFPNIFLLIYAQTVKILKKETNFFKHIQFEVFYFLTYKSLI